MAKSGNIKGIDWPADKVERRPVDTLVPYARNARTHSESQVAQIAASITEYGFTVPVLIDPKGNVIAGHGRIMAAKALGLAEIPVMVAKGWSAAKRRAYVILDNQVALNAGWDNDLLKLELDEIEGAGFDLSLLGFDPSELAGIRDTRPGGATDPDDVPEAPAAPVAIRGDVWALGRHRLMCGDSTSANDVAVVLDGRLADMCLTSPPYGVGLDYGGDYLDTFDGARNLIRAVAPMIFQALRLGGIAIINFGDIVSAQKINQTPIPSEYPMALEYWPAFSNVGFVLNSRRVWAKPHARVAAPWTASSNRAASDWEHLWTWIKPGSAHRNKRIGMSPLGVWDTSKLEGVTIGKDTHPAAFPVGLANLAIDVHSGSGEWIFEPFSGTGTTIISADITGRNCAAMDISERYVDVAIQRWQNFTGQSATIDGKTFEQVKADRQKKAA